MQQHPLVRGADLERRGNLRRAEPLDVTQDDDRLLTGRELRDRGAQALHRLAAEQSLLRSRTGRRRPRPWSLRIVCRQEPVERNLRIIIGPDR